jgi:hypothetical protein
LPLPAHAQQNIWDYSGERIGKSKTFSPMLQNGESGESGENGEIKNEKENTIFVPSNFLHLLVWHLPQNILRHFAQNAVIARLN